MSVFDRLEQARIQLLDLSARNRLISSWRGKRVKAITIVDEMADQVFRILVTEAKTMSFVPARESLGYEGFADAPLLLQPEDEVSENGLAKRHTDTRLQTDLTSGALQKRLLQMHYDARTFEEEQGVSILFLAIGMLKWHERADADKPRFAPLILLPVALTRDGANSRFRISFRDEELLTNISLQAKLRQDFAISLPELPAEDDLVPSRYFEQVRNAIAAQTRWEVIDNDMVLGFFSFAKFLMYRDLDPDSWPANRRINAHPLIAALLGDGFPPSENILGDDINIDRTIDIDAIANVVDADSSQLLALHDVSNQRNLVIQGPPGTGKSQTIVNLIASAVRDGKRVLFMAEKMAALEVVKGRLDKVGLGDLCLEIHSHKARKRNILVELERTLDLGPHPQVGLDNRLRQLASARELLNAHVTRMHTGLQPAGFTPYQLIGQLVRLSNEGTGPQDYHLPAALTWSRGDIEQRRDGVAALSAHISRIGTPAGHPWRGTHVTAILPQDLLRLSGQIAELRSSLAEMCGDIQRLRDILGTPITSWRTLLHALNLADLLIDAPPLLDRSRIAAPEWTSERATISVIVDTGTSFRKIRRQVDGAFAPDAWDEDLAPIRRIMKAYARSWLRGLSKDYRNATRHFRSILTADMPSTVPGRLALIDLLSRAQKTRSDLLALSNSAQSAFGTAWLGEESDWDALRAIDQWERRSETCELPADYRRLIERFTPSQYLPALVTHLRDVVTQLRNRFDTITAAIDLNVQEAFGVGDIHDVALQDIISRLEQWHSAPELIHEWITYRARAQLVCDHGLESVVVRLYDGRMTPDSAVNSFLFAVYETLMRECVRQSPDIGMFDGLAHNTIADHFRTLDTELIRLRCEEICYRHRAALPQRSNVGEMGVLTREMHKKRRHLPLRRLLTEAGHAIQGIKPVFMMSPMSIAQYLQPGVLHFDLLIVDEASQVEPVDALGAIARSSQIVVVGDELQLPPTRFFHRTADGDDEDSDDADSMQLGDLESILGLCSAQGMHSRMLRWHYRSKHESLIAVSNHEFYRDRLFIVPSAARDDHIGLCFERVHGIYDRGGSAANRIEAKIVAEAVLAHARRHLDLSLGVGTFSVAQRDAILDELELLRRQHPECEGFFHEDGDEPFFVKNLESIQGDERDHIFISIGYGPDSSGYLAMTFGPLSSDGGERRLNVLITRARRQCRVFSSISHSDIDLERARTRGVAALKAFLQYAETGYFDVGRSSGRDPDSPFEEEVTRALRSLGFDVENQIGVAGFFVDIGVRDPAKPGRFILGIECDGASYHSSRSARDRDRLRQQVLVDRGWNIHRIWSTDWFKNSDAELRKVLAAIEQATASGHSGSTTPVTIGVSSTGGDSRFDIEREASELGDSAGNEVVRQYGVVPYQEARFDVASTVEPHEASAEKMIRVVTAIVDIEGAIHGEEVGRRVASLWQKERAGSRIQAATQSALHAAVRNGLLKTDGTFYWSVQMTVFNPRDRSHVNSATLSRADMLPPQEIQVAVHRIVECSLGARVDEVVRETIRVFGLRRTGSELRDRVEHVIRKMLDIGLLVLRQGKLYIADPQIDAQ